MRQLAAICTACCLAFPALASAETFALRGDASRIWFIGTKNSAVAVTGSFGALSGALDTEARSGFVQVGIGSLATGDATRDVSIATHLFGAAEHPTARFDVREVSGADALPAVGQSVPIEASGALLLRGRTIELTLPLRLSAERGPAGGTQLRLQTRGPTVLTGEQLGLEPAFAVLQAVCGHASLSRAVPIQVDLVFAKP